MPCVVGRVRSQNGKKERATAPCVSQCVTLPSKYSQFSMHGEVRRLLNQRVQEKVVVKEAIHHVGKVSRPTQPARAVCKMEAQLQYVPYTLLTRLAPICMLSRCLLATFLHRSSVGSLLRVHCWLGNCTKSHCVHPELTVATRRGQMPIWPTPQAAEN